MFAESTFAGGDIHQSCLLSTLQVWTLAMSVSAVSVCDPHSSGDIVNKDTQHFSGYFYDSEGLVITNKCLVYRLDTCVQEIVFIFITGSLLMV